MTNQTNKPILGFKIKMMGELWQNFEAQQCGMWQDLTFWFWFMSLSNIPTLIQSEVRTGCEKTRLAWEEKKFMEGIKNWDVFVIELSQFFD